MKEAIFLTGVAGFIGFHVASKLLKNGCRVVGVDNLNDYYSVELKKARLDILVQNNNFTFVKVDLADVLALKKAIEIEKPVIVVHLAAQAGVRYSFENPNAYIQSNLIGFFNVIESCKKHNIKHFVYASSSSVYGESNDIPFSVIANTDKPISLYAATKKCNEVIAYNYSHAFGINTTGLRFFTVYGPWGRPDMAPFLFLEAIQKGNVINVFNNGEMMRDFTYIDDAVDGVHALIANILAGKTNKAKPPHRIYNVGNNQPVMLMDFVKTLEDAIGKKARMNFLPMQPGDVPMTYADIDELTKDVGFVPQTSIKEGISKFVEWWSDYREKRHN